MIINRNNYSPEKCLEIYKQLLLPRKIEEKMLKLLRQNKLSKWFSGIGQEAIAVGLTQVCSEEDYILTMHRNLGVFTGRNVPFYPLFCQLLGKADGFSKGRERSFHFGILEHKIVGMISHLAAMMPVADGLALASKLQNKNAVSFSFCGDGATSEGDFHEALNLAAVWNLPVVFVIENNGFGLSTPNSEQFACTTLADKGVGYGIESFQIDGNDIFEVMEIFQNARDLALSGKPVLIEAMTFRMRGHEEASGSDYVPDTLLKDWIKKDPILRMEEYLLKEKVIDSKVLQAIGKELESVFKEDLNNALDAEFPVFNEEVEMKSVFAEAPTVNGNRNSGKSGKIVEKRFIDAIQTALRQSMEEDDRTLILGQDIAEYGGVFKITDGFLESFGKERVRNTPIIESGAIGAALGLSYAGFNPIVEMQFADFITCGFNQIVNNVAKSHYRWSKPINMTIRAPHGAGVGAGPFHSQSPEGWFMQVPGLKIVVPSSVEDAQNLLYSSILDPNPVLFFEHKKLYRSLKSKVPEYAVYEELGKAKVLKEGKDATIITYGQGVHWAMETLESLEEKGISIEVIDLRCLIPLDLETITKSVKKTGRVLLLQEPSLTLGPLSEISALISEHCFEYLDAPIIRCASLDMPIPFNKGLEEGYLAKSRLMKSLDRLLQF